MANGIDQFIGEAGLPLETFQSGTIAGAGGGGSAFNAFGAGPLAGIGGLIGGPVGAGVGGVLGLIGSGLMTWLGEKDKEEERERTEKRYREQIAEQRRQWEANYQLQQQQLKLDKHSLLRNIRNDALTQKNFIDKRNTTRSQQRRNDLLGLLNQPDYKNRFMRTWGQLAQAA